MTDISKLIERVEKATGPDRELDCRIAYTLDFSVDGMGNSFRDFCDVFERDWAEISRRAEMHQSILSHNLPRVTASIDSALALLERVRPGWVCDTLGQDATGTLGDMRGIGWTAEFSNGLQSCQGQAPTLPLAIILALLLSLQSEADK